MSYTGKQFEQDFFEQAKEWVFEALVTRLHDTTNKFRGIANPCDYIIATKYGTVFAELKTVKGVSLPFSNISDYQWKSLLKAEMNSYSLGGLLVYFQRNDKLVWYPLAHLQHLKQAGEKSINCETSPEWGFEVEHTKKRVRLTIPFKNVLEAFEKHWQEVENGKAETS